MPAVNIAPVIKHRPNRFCKDYDKSDLCDKYLKV